MDVLQPPTQLQEVTLSNTFVSGDDLAALLCRVGHSLRVVSFRWVRLTSESRDRWKEILETLRDRCPYLDTVDLSWSRITPRALANFPLIAENPVVVGLEAREFEFCGPRGIGAVKYSGPRMDVALQRLVDSTQCPPGSLPGSLHTCYFQHTDRVSVPAGDSGYENCIIGNPTESGSLVLHSPASVRQTTTEYYAASIHSQASIY